MRMHFAFVDIACDYAADRPDQNEPLGGTTSAVCFLARELTKAGITCTFFNKIREPKTAHGIQALPIETLIDERLNSAYTAFIFCGRWAEWLVNLLRESTRVPLIAWMHESTFNAEFVPALEAFDGVAFVSEWQQRINQLHLRAHWRQAVLRNAMNPRAVDVFAPGKAIVPAKTQPPVLLYAGATPRGVFHMPPLLERLYARQKNFTAEIYCDCAPTRDVKANEAFKDRMRRTPNVTHVGMIGQTELLQKMKRAAFMIAPNPWPETSCIALIEAMAAGLTVITTNRAALPETAAGFAHHIAIDDPDHPVRFDMPVPYEAFAETIIAAMDEWAQKPGETERRLQTQIAYFKAHYQWAQRVQPWVAFVKSFT